MCGSMGKYEIKKTWKRPKFVGQDNVMGPFMEPLILPAPPVHLQCLCTVIVPPSWPENNLPKQITRQGFHPNCTEMIESTIHLAAIFSNASTLTKDKKKV